MIRLHLRKRPDGRVEAYHMSHGGGVTVRSSSRLASEAWFLEHAKLLAGLTVDAGMVTVMRTHQDTCDMDVDCTCLPD